MILASRSAARQRLLEHACVPFKTIASRVSEAPIKAACKAEKLGPMETAMALARAKANDVGKDCPDDLVLGADQILTCGDIWLNKPVGRDGLRAHLRQLEGRSHKLINAAVVVQNGAIAWQHQDAITMVMRQLSEAFIEAYVNEVGEIAAQSVGGYQLEGLGAQLFDSADGDFFSILGLPLLPLMAFLRGRNVVPS